MLRRKVRAKERIFAITCREQMTYDLSLICTDVQEATDTYQRAKKSQRDEGKGDATWVEKITKTVRQKERADEFTFATTCMDQMSFSISLMCLESQRDEDIKETQGIKSWLRRM